MKTYRFDGDAAILSSTPPRRLETISVALLRSGFFPGEMVVLVRASEPATFPMDWAFPTRVNDSTLMPSGPTVPNGMPRRVPFRTNLGTLALVLWASAARWTTVAGSAIPAERQDPPFHRVERQGAAGGPRHANLLVVGSLQS